MLSTYKQISDLQHDALTQLDQLLVSLESLHKLTKSELIIEDEWKLKDLLKTIDITSLYYKHAMLRKIDDLHGLKQLDEELESNGFKY